MDQFTEMRNIPNIKDNAVFRVVEGKNKLDIHTLYYHVEPYNLREARVHIRHLREIIRSNDISDAINGVDFASFSCLSNITHASEEINRKLSTRFATDFVRAETDCIPPEWLLPSNSDVPFKPLIPLGFSNDKNPMEHKPNQFNTLKQISFSAFNPPPGPRKLKVLLPRNLITLFDILGRYSLPIRRHNRRTPIPYYLLHQGFLCQFYSGWQIQAWEINLPRRKASSQSFWSPYRIESTFQKNISTNTKK